MIDLASQIGNKLLMPVISLLGGAILFRLFLWWRFRKIKELYSVNLHEMIRSYENFSYFLIKGDMKGSVITLDDMGYRDLSFWYKYSRFLFSVEKKKTLDNTLKLLKGIHEYEEEFADIKLDRESFKRFEVMCRNWAHCYYTLINLSLFGGNPKVNRHTHMDTVLYELDVPRDEIDARNRYMKRNNITYTNARDEPHLIKLAEACSEGGNQDNS